MEARVVSIHRPDLSTYLPLPLYGARVEAGFPQGERIKIHNSLCHKD
jgi:hypothetical protein